MASHDGERMPERGVPATPRARLPSAGLIGVVPHDGHMAVAIRFKNGKIFGNKGMREGSKGEDAPGTVLFSLIFLIPMAPFNPLSISGNPAAITVSTGLI